jgi:hypothetical protein
MVAKYSLFDENINISQNLPIHQKLLLAYNYGWYPRQPTNTGFCAKNSWFVFTLIVCKKTAIQCSMST